MNSRKRFLRWAYQDAGGLAHDLSQRRTALYAVGAMALLTPLSTLDRSIDFKVGEYPGG